MPRLYLQHDHTDLLDALDDGVGGPRDGHCPLCGVGQHVPGHLDLGTCGLQKQDIGRGMAGEGAAGGGGGGLGAQEGIMSRVQCTDTNPNGTMPAWHLSPLLVPWGPMAGLVRLSPPLPSTAWHRDNDAGQEAS